MGQMQRLLGPDERVEIARLRAVSLPWRRIGAPIGRSHMAVSQEVIRNSCATTAWPRGYAPVRAPD